MDQAALDEMGSKGPWIIEERSSWPRVAARLNAVYAWMLEREKAPDFVYLSKTDMPEGWGTGGNGHAIARDRRKPTSMLPPISIPRLSPQASDVVVRYALTHRHRRAGLAHPLVRQLLGWRPRVVVHGLRRDGRRHAPLRRAGGACLRCSLATSSTRSSLFRPEAFSPTNALDAVKVGFYAGAGLVTLPLLRGCACAKRRPRNASGPPKTRSPPRPRSWPAATQNWNSSPSSWPRT